MASIPLPALSVRPPEQPDVIGQVGKVMSLKSMMQGQALQQQQLANEQQANQSGAIDLQMKQQAMTDQQAMTKAMHEWDGKDIDSLVPLVSKNGGSAQAVMGLKQKQLELREKYSAIAKNDADTGEKNLATMKGKNDMVAGAIQSVIDAPDAELPARLTATVQDMLQKGLIDQQHAQTAQQMASQIATLPPAQARSQLGIMKKSYQADSQQMEDASKSAGIKKDLAQATEATAKTTLTNTENANFGKPTEKDKYVQHQENYRATLARQASTANELQKQGITSLQKQGDTYSQFLGTANSLKNSLAAAKDGNQMAAAVAPLQGTLFITTSEGVKRINETELKGVAGAGSLVQRIEGALGKQTGDGPLSPQLKDDMGKLVDLYVKSKHDAYANQANYTMKLHGMDSTKTPILSQDGTIAGSQPTQPMTITLPSGKKVTIE